LHLNDSVTTLPQISPRYASLLAKLGIFTIRDLITHFPRYHKDTSVVTNIGDISEEGEYTLQVFPKSINSVRLRGGRTMQKAILSDHTGNIPATWFNQPYLQKALNSEQEYMFVGKVKQVKTRFEIYPVSFEPIIEGRELVHLGRIAPQYALTAGVSIKWLRNRIKYVLDHIDSLEDLEDELQNIADCREPRVEEAIKHLHFPASEAELIPSQTKLQISELTNLQLKMQVRRDLREKLTAPTFHASKIEIEEFIDQLPYTLTNDQWQAVSQVLSDCEKSEPMYRLLQGDVGSGKTIVAIISALSAKLSGYQTAILAPTTVLAAQHFASFSKMLKGVDVKIELVTSINKHTEPADILIGTSAVLARKHDLIQNLGLVVVDEQHRFGVQQREELLEPFKLNKNRYPHCLNMTATPIPRTLALGLFGDIEISTILTKPAGRLPIKTHIVPENKRTDAYSWIDEQARQGAQIYWMCSLVEGSEKLEIKSAKETFEILRRDHFPHLKLGLLHGQMKPAEKEKVMQDFKDQKLNILVTTSVIEVGIDVPTATIMVIEDADRFGLAQLHQIRGRVGRNDLQSWCFLFTSPEITPGAKDRLEFFATHSDGLEIAEFDLQNRGPGEVYGTRQSGIPNLKIANLANIEMVKRSKSIAGELYKAGVRRISLFGEN
jgi:ATP-dependent DNA helicase RecG